MKKLVKIISCLTLAFAIGAGCMAFSSSPVMAAAPVRIATVPLKARAYVDFIDSRAVKVDYVNYGDQILNLKSSSKNLIVRQTNQRYSDDSIECAYLGLYAKKSGSYTVTFDVYASDGVTKRSSHKIQVLAQKRLPVKSIKFGGKKVTEDYYLTTKKKGKLAVKMNSNYVLRKIEYVTYDANGKEAKAKIIKNNKTLTLGRYGRGGVVDNSYTDAWTGKIYKRGEWIRSLEAPTKIIITYYDKWMGVEDTWEYNIIRLSD